MAPLVAVIDCSPSVLNVTLAYALPLTNVTVAGSTAAASVEVNDTVPEYPQTGLPVASTADNATVTGTPVRTVLGSLTVNEERTGAATTAAVAEPTMFPAAPPRTETVWSPAVAKVTRTTARPLRNVTVPGRIAPGSLLVTVAVPL